MSSPPVGQQSAKVGGELSFVTTPWPYRLMASSRRALEWLIDYFRDHAPTVRNAFVPLLLLTILLYVRHPATNYIFDEQEALLANPYVNGIQGLRFTDVIYRDFWGLPPDASIGSYRPLPNVLWRLTWLISKHPFVHHLYNLLFHALNGALLGSFALSLTKRRNIGWLTGLTFVTSAVITEAVSGIVGLADVLGGLGAIAALCSLRWSAALMPVGVFASVLFGLFAKESALVCVPLVPAAAFLCSHLLHSQRPARFVRMVLALAAALGAFVLYVELRKVWFPSPLSAELQKPLDAEVGQLRVLFHELLVWFRQAPLPKDPFNNPLADANFGDRLAGALRVYFRGLSQVALPFRLSGDYSFSQEPVPTNRYAWESVAGGFMMVFPLVAGLGMLIGGRIHELLDRRWLLRPSALTETMRRLDASTANAANAPEAALYQLPAMPFHRKTMGLAACVLTAGLSALGTELVMLQAGGPRHVHTWPYAIPLIIVGMGLLVDGWKSVPRPMASTGAWPWRHVMAAFVSLGLVWMVVSYFPHSNIPVVLPTVRAERFWYFPVIGSAMVIATIFSRLAEEGGNRMTPRARDGWKARLGSLRLPIVAIGAFYLLQSVQAYSHAMDYRDDLAFWKATKEAVPNSAKAHLNYSVMVGARGDLETRLIESRIAAKLAPQWPMAHVYVGDTLCRLHRPTEAWAHYERGFEIGHGERGLIALALQCLYDEEALLSNEEALRALSDKHPGSWLSVIADDTLDNHEEHKGVDPQYRPRSYNESAKE